MFRLIKVIAQSGHADTLCAIAETHEAEDFWVEGADDDGQQCVNILIGPNRRQAFMDALQTIMDRNTKWRIVILPVEATVPTPKAKDDSKDAKKSSVAITREELYNDVAHGAQLNNNFLLLVFLSTLVAAIGLLANNVAVLVGAMVIAPLLGPHLAFALATATGDFDLMKRALTSGVVGLSLGFAVSLAIGFIIPFDPTGVELVSRTIVGLDGVVLALASGAAAALSLTTGLSSVLVGVMVAVALLPPAVAVGLLLGAGREELALGAALLLAVNMVCINLSAQLVLIAKGIQPRSWLEKRAAKQSRRLNLIIWTLCLIVLIAFIYWRTT